MVVSTALSNTAGAVWEAAVTSDATVTPSSGCIHGVVRRPSGLRQPFAHITTRDQAGDPVHFYNNGATTLGNTGASEHSGEFAACGFPTGSYTVEAVYSNIFESLLREPVPVDVTAGEASLLVEVSLVEVAGNPICLPIVEKEARGLIHSTAYFAMTGRYRWSAVPPATAVVVSSTLA